VQLADQIHILYVYKKVKLMINIKIKKISTKVDDSDKTASEDRQ